MLPSGCLDSATQDYRILLPGMGQLALKPGFFGQHVRSGNAHVIPVRPISCGRPNGPVLGCVATRHLPPARHKFAPKVFLRPTSRLIRRYGLYSSRSRGTWSRKPHLARLAPKGWQKNHQRQPSLRLGMSSQGTPDQSVSVNESRSAWARLLAKVYEVDPLRCTRCGSQMRVLAVITDSYQVLRIPRHLIKTGAAPPGLDAASLS